MLRRATPERAPMSIPTSIVVVHDRTSIAVDSCRGVIAPQIDILEAKFMLLGLGVHILGLSGVQLSGVLGSDECHRAGRARGLGP